MQEEIVSQQFGPGLAAFLGLVEGLTELLPVSSTGHLILAGHMLGFTGDIAISVDICIQLGSILAIIVYERKKIFSLLNGARMEQRALWEAFKEHQPHHTSSSQGWTIFLAQFWQDHPNLRFLLGLGIAFFPSAVVGLLTHKWIEAHLFSPQMVAISLIIGGMIIFAVEMGPKRVRYSHLEEVGIRSAFLIGIAQCFALIPGMSRSGSTIVGGLLSGLDRRVATEYSFFLALPTMIAATVYKLVQSHQLFSVSDAFALFVGMVVSFFVAWAVIALFLSFVKRHTLLAFSYYRIGFGALLLIVLH